MTQSGLNEPAFEEKVITCHCGASFAQWSLVKDYADSSVYRICPSCFCYLQKLTLDQHGNPKWVNLPENPRSCSEIGNMRKCGLLITEQIAKVRETCKRFLHRKVPTPQGLDRWLEQGWRLRRKKIKGRFYAYLQLGKKYKYVGPWKPDYENR